MTTDYRFVLLATLASVLLAGAASAETIEGRYLVVRHTGSSTQASELPAAGDTAVMAWKVSQGNYQGTQLDGLAVVAMVCGDSAIGIEKKAKTRTVFLVDKRATKTQQKALVAMAKSLAGSTIGEVVEVKSLKIDMNVCRGCAAGYASLKTELVNIRTRRLLDSDKVDHDKLVSVKQEVADPVLSKLFYRYPAYALEYSYSGSNFEGKSVRFVDKDLRSAAVGGFWF